MRRRNKIERIRAAAAVVLAVLLCGCGGKSSAPDGMGGARPNAAADNSGVSPGQVGTVTTLDVSKLFTDRDKESDYREDDCRRIALQDGTVTISEEGSYILSGRMNGSIVIDAGKKDKIRLILEGADVSSENSAALYVKQADKVFVTLAAGSENRFCSKGEFADTDGNKIDGAVFAKDDITFNGDGALTVECETGHGIVSKDDLAVTGGVYRITAGKHGLQGKDSVRILAGEISVTAAQDGIHSGNDEDETVGYTYVGGGNLTLKAGDDGIHSDTQLVIESGDITVTESYEGLEGNTVEITGGVICVNASDDGVNAAGGNDGSGGSNGDVRRGRFDEDPFAADKDSAIIISGGALTVHANGDGLDSNGAFYVNGGVITVYGPVNGANGALDYNGDSAITGGTLIALGASQMAQNFGENSTQASILVNVQATQAAGTTAELRDQSGKVLLSVTAEKPYNSAVFSCPELEVGQTYTVVMGEQTTEVELTELIYGKGMGGFGGHGGFKPGGFGGPNGFRPGGDRGDFDPGRRPGGDRGDFEPGKRPDGGREKPGEPNRPERE